MKRTGFLGSLSSATLIAATAGVSVAEAQSPQGLSNENLRVARARITGFIAELQTEKADYAGERGVAIGRLQAALAEIDAALAFQNATVPTQAMSDAVLRNVRERIGALVGGLRNDNADYGGHRVKAIADLQAANAALATALGVS